MTLQGGVLTVLGNIFILAGIPILVVLALDRHKKQQRNKQYYWQALALVVLADALLFLVPYACKAAMK